MGGHGSGRKPDVVKMMHDQINAEEVVFEGEQLILPSLGAAAKNPKVQNDLDNRYIAYGEVFTNDNTNVTAVSSSGFTQFLHFDTNGHANDTTPDQTENHIVIDKAGVYAVECCVNIKNSSGNAHDIEVVISKNNNTTIFPNMRRHRTLGTGTDVGAIPICGHLGLEVGDTIELWITSSSASARNVTAEDVVLMVTLVSAAV